MASFHFLRPEWLLALLPAAILAALLHRRLREGRNDWAREVDPHLLAHLALPGRRASGQWPAVLLFAGWVAAAFAMAGPTWQKLPQPVTGRLDPLVIAVNLSPTMNAPDASPSRLVAARYKIADVLQRMRGSEVALVLYSDIPFAAAPLTEDAHVVAQMLPDLSTSLMRGNANRPQAAIAMAVDLLKGAGAASGRILLVTDGPGDEPGKTQAAAKAAAAEGYKVNVIGVGADGANGAPAVDTAALKAIATAGQGAYTPLTADDRDIAAALPPVATTNGAVTDSEGFTADVWADMGPYVLLLALLLAPLAFRRGWIAVLAVTALGGLAAPQRAEAQTIQETVSQNLPQSWADLWWRPDQQGAADYARGDYSAAAQKFEDPAWKADALYKAGDYSGASAALSRLPGRDYNRGNALARAGQLEQAVAAYDKALAANPDNADAKFNRDLVQKLIDAKKKQEEDKQKQDQKQNQAGGGGGPDQSKDQKPDPKSDQKQKQDQKPGGDKPQDAQNSPQPGPLPPPAPLPPRRPPELAQQQPAPPRQPPQEPPPQDQAQQAPPPDSPPAQPPLQNPQQPPSEQPETMAGGIPAAPVTPKEPPPPMPEDKDDGQDAGKQDPNAAFAAPPPAPAQVAQPKPPQPPPQSPPAVAFSDDDQSREQALRQVPDDPGGLLRARIRSQYTGAPVFLSEGDAQ
ncbi:VWA domain-containing protein [Xanthobacter aminoxidans]|uniref:VWA domain-containing protein n=1 Tax=Xanthobacter aminoxidans TaxID=186280 RepID=UPI0037275DFF